MGEGRRSDLGATAVRVCGDAGGLVGCRLGGCRCVGWFLDRAPQAARVVARRWIRGRRCLVRTDMPVDPLTRRRLFPVRLSDGLFRLSSFVGLHVCAVVGCPLCFRRWRDAKHCRTTCWMSLRPAPSAASTHLRPAPSLHLKTSAPFSSRQPLFLLGWNRQEGTGASLNGSRGNSGHRRRRRSRRQLQHQQERRRRNDHGDGDVDGSLSPRRNLEQQPDANASTHATAAAAREATSTGGGVPGSKDQQGGGNGASADGGGGGRAGYGSDGGGRVYYAPTGGVNCTTASTATSSNKGSGSSGDSGGDSNGSGKSSGKGGGARRGDGGEGEGGAYKPMCGVDVVVSPGGDDKYRCAALKRDVGGLLTFGSGRGGGREGERKEGGRD